MHKDSSAKYYQDHKERLQKRLVKNVKVFLKEKKKKSNKMCVNDIKISLKMKNKRWLSVEKVLQNEKHPLTLISTLYKKLFDCKFIFYGNCNKLFLFGCFFGQMNTFFSVK